MGAPAGNNNYRQGKLWTAAIVRALQKRSRTDQLEALDDLAEKLLKKCDELDMQALKELGDRVEGKVAQPIGGADDLSPIRQSMTVDFVSPIPRET